VPHDSSLEFEFPADFLGGLRGFVNEVARQRKLPAPFDIRLTPETVAYVYEDERGARILVIGCIAVAALSQKALAGVIAHELGHFGAGDTALSQEGGKRFQLIACLEHRFSNSTAMKWNPLVWLVRAYHYAFLLAWCAYSREAEYAADRQEVAIVGSEEAAATLILLEVMEKLPWSRLSSIASGYLRDRERIDNLFAEQVRRARTSDPEDWRSACQKLLKQKPSLFDTHPVLKARLKAMGVSPRKAVNLAIDLFREGEPAQNLFPNWPLLEKIMTRTVMDIFRQYCAAKQEMAQIFAGGR
jgi:Zn-dependent protease with chaperone function